MKTKQLTQEIGSDSTELQCRYKRARPWLRKLQGASMLTGVHDLLFDKKIKPEDINSCSDEVLKDTNSVDVICPLGCRRARAKLGGMCVPQLVFCQTRGQNPCFWNLLPAPVIGGQVCGLLSLTAEGMDGHEAFFRRKKNGTDLAA